jgi:plasmid stability protein
MAQLLVRNLDDDVKDKLKAKAARYKMPLEALVREILLEAALKEEPEVGFGTAAAALFQGIGLKKHEWLPELRGETMRNPFEDLGDDEDAEDP